MRYWVDKNSENNNVIVVNESSIFIGSCDEDSYKKVDDQLAAEKAPIEVLGSDDLTVIPFNQIQNIVSRSTDEDVDIRYLAKKEIEEKTLDFYGLEEKNEFISAIEAFVPERLEKSESEQSAIVAGISPLISLAFGISIAYLFFDKFRWLTIIIGGIWILVSLYALVSRIKEPPTITRWGIRGRYFRKMWSGIKTGFSYVVLALIVFAVYEKFPDSYGKKSIYEQMYDGSLNASDISLLIDRGADINYENKDGEDALLMALSWGEDDIVIALIESGADLATKNGASPLELAVGDSSVHIIESMLQKGASLDFEMEGLTPLEYAKEYRNAEIANVIEKHANSM